MNKFKTIVGISKGVSEKTNKPYVKVYTVSDEITDKPNVVGKVAQGEYLPPYLHDKADGYVGRRCVISYSKYNDKYTVSSVDVVD